jgi:hypothetical protein
VTPASVSPWEGLPERSLHRDGPDRTSRVIQPAFRGRMPNHPLESW